MNRDHIESISQNLNQTLQSTKNLFSRRETQNHDIELQSSENEQNAVLVTNAYKNYGSLVVLKDLKMKVRKGAIYALLGASGCGKTTLLSCLVGRKSFASGYASVLGEKPGSPNLTTKIGYMPQETGLHRGFTIKETLIFFGRVLGMPSDVINERTEFLVELLMLPGCDYNINDLSGGQQRRVSLAIAFLHEPELLILDEPTVGTDAVVREVIWRYFLDITKTKNVTIIITTHYIEETSQADIVGIMRAGYLIAEDNPKTLLQRHEVTSLEDVFLKLSVEQDTNKQEIDIIANNWCNYDCFTIPSVKLNHVNVLMWKHWLWMRKNLNQIIIMLMLPVFLITMFCLAVGHNPVNIKVAVVNGETVDEHCNDAISCDNNEISCSFLKYLEQSGLILIPYQTEQDSIKSVQQGETYASILIRQNYSKALRTRVHHWFKVKATDLEKSTIDVFRDVSNKQISLFIQMYLYRNFETFFYKFVDSCNLSRTEMSFPIRINSVYEGTNLNFTDFCTPGVILSISFILGLLLTAWTMLLEKNEASLDRTLVVGINKNELLLSHGIVQFLITSVQIVLVVICTFVIFERASKGSLVLVTIMLLLTGIAAVTFGLLISCVCDSQVGVTLIAMGLYLSILLASGFIWPIEAMHPWLKPFSAIFPLTKPTESLRYIMHRGWNFFHQDVYLGFLTISAWSIIFILINVFFLKF